MVDTAGNAALPDAAPLSLRLADRRPPAFALTLSHDNVAHVAFTEPVSIPGALAAAVVVELSGGAAALDDYEVVAYTPPSPPPLDLSDPQCSSVCFAAAFPNYLSGAGYMWFSQDCIDYQGGHGCIYNTAASSSGWGCRLCNTKPGTDGGYEYGECPPCVERHYATPPPPAPPASPPPVTPGRSFAEYWANPVLLHLNISLSLSALPDGAESLCVSLAPAAISDGAGLAALACRQCVNLVEKIPPTLSVSLDANNNLLATFDEPVRLASHLGGGDLTAAAFSVSDASSAPRRGAGRPGGSGRHAAGALGRRRVLFQCVGWGLGEEEGVHLRAVGQLGDGVVAIRRGRVGDGVRRRDGRESEHAAVRRQPRRVGSRGLGARTRVPRGVVQPEGVRDGAHDLGDGRRAVRAAGRAERRRRRRPNDMGGRRHDELPRHLTARWLHDGAADRQRDHPHGGSGLRGDRCRATRWLLPVGAALPARRRRDHHGPRRRRRLRPTRHRRPQRQRRADHAARPLTERRAPSALCCRADRVLR